MIRETATGTAPQRFRVATIGTDERGLITHWSPQAESLWGPRAEEVLGREAAEVLGESIPDVDRLAHALRQGTPLEAEGEIRQAAAPPRRCHISVTPVADPSGGVARMAVAVDVTEGWRTEQRLRAQYAATRSLAESSTVDEAARRLLRSVGESIGWDAAALWQVDADETVVRPVDFWSARDVDAAAFEKAVWGSAFPPGRGLPGLVWSRGEAIWFRDIQEADDFTRVEAARTDGLHAGFSFPIRVGERIVGTVEFFHREVREPDPELLEAMDAVGGQVGQFIERTRILDALREEERRLQQALDAGSMGAWDWEVASGTVTWSPNLERIHGLEPGTFGGTFEDFMADMHPEDRGRVEETVRRALGEDQPYRVEYRIVRPDGAIRWVEARGEVRRDEEGRPVRMTGICADVTHRREAEDARDRLLLQAEEAQQRLAFLAEASVILGSSLRTERTLDKLAHLLVPRLADWCSIDLLVEGSIRQMALVHPDPEQMELAREIRHRFPPNPASSGGIAGVMRTREPVLIPELTEEMLVAAAENEDHLRLLRRLDIRSAMIVPLAARGRVLGSITFASAHSGRTFGETDLDLAQDLARRAAVAVDNARLYEERSAIARTLQRSLLPPSLPRMEGFEVAALYLPAGEGNEVGGDFYDVVQRDRDDWTVVVGDVCGKGPEAAALTGLTRYTLRAAVIEEPQPSRALQQLNDAVLREGADRFCTAALARVTRRDGRALLTVSCGGHPRPLLIRRGGEMTSVGRHGTLLGSFPNPALSDEAVELDPGDTVVFYTDGFVEDREADTIGSGQIRALLERCVALEPAQAVAECLEAGVRELNPGGSRDDVAIVVLRVRV